MKELSITEILSKKKCFICGAFGSGKTEVSINLAIKARNSGMNISLMDLDIVNLYFRSRQAADILNQKGVYIIKTSQTDNLMDLPALSPQIAGELDNLERFTIIDLGGDDIGTRVLGRYKLNEYNSKSLMVLNTFRPFTDSKDKIMRVIEQISLKLPGPIDALILNSNIGSETDKDYIQRGLDLIFSLNDIPPVAAIGVWEKILDEKIISIVKGYNLPILKLKRYMEPFRQY
jgi:hypothetical protein